PKGRVVPVRSKDGTRLHTEVFGPDDGYPIVLAHGITCALRVWAYQIADLSTDYRVIAFDHRGHGKSAVPPRRNHYSLDFLAAGSPPRSRWAATPTRRSWSSSTSCSPRHRPLVEAAGPAPWSTRSAPSISS